MSFVEVSAASENVNKGNDYSISTSKNNPNMFAIGSNNKYINFKLINAINKNIKTNENKVNKVNKAKKVNKANKNKLGSGCCSVVLQGSNNSFAYGFRRDHSYSVDMHIKKTKLNGKTAIKTYKLKKGYFTHAVVLEGGWFIGIGGWDNPQVNKKLEKLGGKIASNGKITTKNMNTALKILKTIGMGHFVIKRPDGTVGVVIYNRGNKGGTIKTVFKMKRGEYVSVPNGPSMYRKGKYPVIKSNLVNSAIRIAGTDKWGYQRRNIIIFNVKITNTTSAKNTTNIKIWASNDNGKYVGRNSGGLSDNIIFGGVKTNGKSLPIIPNKKYIGQAILK